MSKMKSSIFNLFLVFSLLLTLILSGGSASASENRDGLRIQLIDRLQIALKFSDAQPIVKCLERFEQRSSRFCSNDEQSSCYSRMLRALTECDDRELPKTGMLCWHLIMELADPTQVNQGNHNTCALAALQSFLYSKEPLLVCDTVLKAKTGKIILTDGREIYLSSNNIAPDMEAKFFRPNTCYRSYAAQLFQLAAANIFWQSQCKDPRGIAVPQGAIRYVQDYTRQSESTDTRERLLICWSEDTVEQVVADGKLEPESSPSFCLDAIDATYKLMKGSKNSPVLLAHKKRGTGKPVLKFSSEEDLAKNLSRLKEDGVFPAIISVNMASRSFSSNSQLKVVGSNIRASSTGGWHVVCVDDYDANTGDVAINNSWGPESDFLGDRRMSLHDLFISSSVSAPAEKNFPAYPAGLLQISSR